MPTPGLTIRNKLIYQLALWVVLIASLVLLVYLSPTLVDPRFLAADDFGHFWSAGRLIILGQNPYDQTLIVEMLYQIGRLPITSHIVSVMLNPPWTLPIVMIFGMFNFPVSRLLWLLGNISILIFCANQLWIYYGGSTKTRWIALILAFTFTPTIAVLQKGQFTPLILLGVVCYLQLVDRTQLLPNQRRINWTLLALTGITLVLMAIKPQLTYLFWLALLLWSIQRKSWIVLLSGILMIMFACALPMIFKPDLIGHYIASIMEYPLSQWATPTIGSYLRVIFGTQYFWLQFLPPIIGSLWFMAYWFPRRNDWHWGSEMPMILLVSLVTSPYYWTYDLIIAIPALIVIAIVIFTHFQHRIFIKTEFIIIFSYLVLTILNLILHRYLDEYWFGWFAPALLLLSIIFTFQKESIKLHPDKG